MAEVLDKFEEDVLRKPTAGIRAKRRAVIAFGKPIPVEPNKGDKSQIHTLTEKLENEVQTLLDNIQLEPCGERQMASGKGNPKRKSGKPPATCHPPLATRSNTIGNNPTHAR